MHQPHVLGSPIDNNYPIHLAIHHNCYSMVKLLIEHFPDMLEQKDASNQTPLLLAARAGHHRIVKLFIEKDAIIDVPSHSGKTALFWALYSDFRGITNLLIDSGAQYYQLIHRAARENNVAYINYLIQKNPKLLDQIDAYGMTPIFYAVKHNKAPAVKLLARSGANLNIISAGTKKNRGQTPLQIAIVSNLDKMIELLIELGADLYSTTAPHYLIHLMVVHSSLHAIQYSIKKYPELINQMNAYKQTPLFVAVLHRRTDVVQFLIKQDGVNLNLAPDLPGHPLNGNTPVHHATEHGTYDMMVLLLNAGALTEVMDKTNQTTLLHIAILTGDIQKVWGLIKHNPQLLNKPNAQGQTPIMYAAALGHLHLMQFLYQQGATADIDIKSVHGSTHPYLALFHAIKEGNPNLIIECLVYHNIISNDTQDTMESQKNADNIIFALCNLFVHNILTEEHLEAIIRHHQPKHLALAFCKLQANNLLLSDISYMIENHPRPLSLAYAICRIKQVELWTADIIQAIYEHPYPANYAYGFLYKDLSNEVENEPVYFQAFNDETAPVTASDHPDFSKSLNQALYYHGVFSAKRSIMDILSSSRHQSPEAQREYDKHYGMELGSRPK